MREKRGAHHNNLQRAMISHELRNALSGVAGLGQQLISSELTPEQLVLVRALHQSTLQMRWLVNALGPDGDNVQFPLAPRLSNLHGIELMEQLIRGHLAPAREKGSALLLCIRPDVPTMWRSDERLLRLVLDNLLGNAVKYGRGGEITMEVLTSGNGLIIQVRDDGPGLDSEAQTRMFDPWVRCEEGRSGVSGAGLGLYLCRCIMARLNGSISYSADGVNGSCFKLNLPGILTNRSRQSAALSCGLLQSLVCLLSLPDGFQCSLVSILSRLGVNRIVTERGRIANLPATVCVIEIAGSRSAHTAVRRQGGLSFTASAAGWKDCGATASRWLPQPFLESTVGPVLMELALQHRIFRTTTGM